MAILQPGVPPAKAERKESEAVYRARVTAATAPGIRYVGTISHRADVVAAEINFTTRPEGLENNVAFVLTIPNTPGFSVEHQGTLNPEALASPEIEDVQVHRVRSLGNAKGGTVPGTLMRWGLESEKTWKLTASEDKLKGVIGSFNGDHVFEGARVK